MEIKMPNNILKTLKELENNGFKAYLVGGCVRDYLNKKRPKDWDITTNAKPEEIIEIFSKKKVKTFYENEFGTVGLFYGGKSDVIEITTFRTESNYKDKRHPEKIEWAKTIEQDLQRRDFTINAMAMSVPRGTSTKIVDLYNGQQDLKDKIIRTVGSPEQRFSEDALRMMRAIRFSSTLGKDWKIEENTLKSIKKHQKWFENISNERKRDELIKIVMSEQAKKGIDMLRETGLLTYIIPELEEGYEIDQNKHHIYDVYTHNLECLDFSAKKDFSFHVRMASLLHDIGKPKTKQGKGINATFYNHEIVGAKMTEKILKRLNFPQKNIKKIVKLVRYHLFYYNVDEVTESSVRKLVKNVGIENINELIQLRMADRIGSGCPKAEPYKLRHLKYIIEKVSKDPISVKMLKINGEDIMKTLKIAPGKQIGHILNILLSEVLNDPKLNKKTILIEKTKELGGLDEKKLEKTAKQSTKEVEEVIQKKDKMAKDKYWLS